MESGLPLPFFSLAKDRTRLMELRRCLWEPEERTCVSLLDTSPAQMAAAHLQLQDDLSVTLVQVRSCEILLEGERGCILLVS